MNVRTNEKKGWGGANAKGATLPKKGGQTQKGATSKEKGRGGGLGISLERLCSLKLRGVSLVSPSHKKKERKKEKKINA